MTALGHEAHLPLAPKIVISQDLKTVWRWFLHLHARRHYARLTEPVQMPDGRLGWRVNSTAEHISSAEVMGWSAMAGIAIEPWQFAALQLIDEFFVKTKNDPPQAAVAATAENIMNMFRAMGMKSRKPK